MATSFRRAREEVAVNIAVTGFVSRLLPTQTRNLDEAMKALRRSIYDTQTAISKNEAELQTMRQNGQQYTQAYQELVQKTDELKKHKKELNATLRQNRWEMRELQEKNTEYLNQIRGWGITLGIATGAIVGMGLAVNNLASNMRELEGTAFRTQVSIHNLQRAARQFAVAIGDTDMGQKMAQSLADIHLQTRQLMVGRGNFAGQLGNLALSGISIGPFLGGNTQQQDAMLLAAVKASENNVLRRSALMEMLGEDTFSQYVHRIGAGPTSPVVLKEDQLAQLKDFRREWTEMQVNAAAFKDQVVVGLAPALTLLFGIIEKVMRAFGVIADHWGPVGKIFGFLVVGAATATAAWAAWHVVSKAVLITMNAFQISMATLTAIQKSYFVQNMRFLTVSLAEITIRNLQTTAIYKQTAAMLLNIKLWVASRYQVLLSIFGLKKYIAATTAAAVVQSNFLNIPLIQTLRRRGYAYVSLAQAQWLNTRATQAGMAIRIQDGYPHRVINQLTYQNTVATHGNTAAVRANSYAMAHQHATHITWRMQAKYTILVVWGLTMAWIKKTGAIVWNSVVLAANTVRGAINAAGQWAATKVTNTYTAAITSNTVASWKNTITHSRAWKAILAARVAIIAASIATWKWTINLLFTTDVLNANTGATSTNTLARWKNAAAASWEWKTILAVRAAIIAATVASWNWTAGLFASMFAFKANTTAAAANTVAHWKNALAASGEWKAILALRAAIIAATVASWKWTTGLFVSTFAFKANTTATAANTVAHWRNALAASTEWKAILSLWAAIGTASVATRKWTIDLFANTVAFKANTTATAVNTVEQWKNALAASRAWKAILAVRVAIIAAAVASWNWTTGLFANTVAFKANTTATTVNTFAQWKNTLASTRAWKAILAVRVAIIAATVATWKWTIALMTNPLVWKLAIIFGVIALATWGVVMAFRKLREEWDKLKDIGNITQFLRIVPPTWSPAEFQRQHRTNGVSAVPTRNTNTTNYINVQETFNISSSSSNAVAGDVRRNTDAQFEQIGERIGQYVHLGMR